jgi:hypothetical protein
MRLLILLLILLLAGCQSLPTRYDADGDGTIDAAEATTGGLSDICAASYIARRVLIDRVQRSPYLSRLDMLCAEMEAPAVVVAKEPVS